MAALSSLPWVGSVIGAAAEFTGENAQQSAYRAMYLWVKAQEAKLHDVSATLQEEWAAIVMRVFNEPWYN
jgi:hypothetical protein